MDGSLRRWQIEALQLMVDAGARLDTVIVNEGGESRILYNLRTAPAYLILAGIRELSIRLFGSQSYLESVSISDVGLLEDAVRVYCEPIPRSDFGQELPRSVVNERCRELDVLIRFGFGIIRGDVLDAPTYGVFSYHHGDLRRYRGRPAGFWEFMHDEDTIGVTLQQLTDELDCGKVIQIEEFDIEPDATYQEVLRTVYLGSLEMLAEAVMSIREDKFNPGKMNEVGELYTAPGWLPSVKYLLKNSIRKLKRR